MHTLADKCRVLPEMCALPPDAARLPHTSYTNIRYRAVLTPPTEGQLQLHKVLLLLRAHLWEPHGL